MTVMYLFRAETVYGIARVSVTYSCSTEFIDLSVFEVNKLICVESKCLGVGGSFILFLQPFVKSVFEPHSLVC